MSSLFGEPPSGIDLSADQMPKINATVIAMCALAAIAVALRFFAKIRVQRSGVAEDDWFILASLVGYSLLHYINGCTQTDSKVANGLWYSCLHYSG